jgi:hypothetical protein
MSTFISTVFLIINVAMLCSDISNIMEIDKGKITTPMPPPPSPRDKSYNPLSGYHVMFMNLIIP